MAIAKRRKRFFDVEIPAISSQTQLLAYEVSELKSRIIKYDLTRILRGKSLVLLLKVNIEGDKAVAVPLKTILLPSFLRRMVRKGTNYVEDSFPAECKNAEVRIKPFLVTRRKVSRSIRNSLRKKAKEELIDYAKRLSSENFIEDVIHGKVQKQLASTLKKIYPLSLCEIRMFEVKKEKAPVKAE
jgi:ribosomal protein S3AE